MTGAAMGTCVDVSHEAGVTTVVMHRNGNNSIADDLMSELRVAFEQAGADPDTRVVILASAYERYFSVGADLTAMAGIDRAADDAEQQIVAMLGRSREGFEAIAGCPKPVIAAINGHALGGGCELALCCDYRIMVEDGRARIGQSEAGLGIMPGAGGTQRLVRLIGRARALPLLYEGTRLGAADAGAIGLVNQAVASDQLRAAVKAHAERLSKAPTFALAMIKDAVDRGQDLPLADALDIEAANFARAALSEDAAVGLMSFLAKQEPEFKGR
jgi:enoyl-CoA hydratase/carnithine racemase